jgi:hypothetical protein
VSVTVAVLMAIVTVPVMPISMAMPVFVIFTVPVPFVVTPTIVVPVVVWMTPIGPGIRRLFVAAGYPAIVVSLGHPEAGYPYHLGCGRGRRGRFIGNRRWSDSDGDGDLTGRR